VAKLAGLPSSVLARAGELLATFESDELKPQKRGRGRRSNDGQLKLFTPTDGSSSPPVGPAQANPAEGAVVERIRGADINRLSPLEALSLLAELKGQLGG
jgi:DNA mismatch repair protein MutS